MAAIIVLAILAFLLFVLAFSCIKIVRPFQRGVVERLGRYKGTVDPGLRIIVPFVDRVHLVDLAPQDAAMHREPLHQVADLEQRLLRLAHCTTASAAIAPTTRSVNTMGLTPSLWSL